MKTGAGVVRFYQAAQEGVFARRRAGYPPNQVYLLYPGSPKEDIRSIPTSETEQPGVGGAIGGVLGGALGVAGGFELGVVATALLPGVGPVVAVGVTGAVLLWGL